MQGLRFGVTALRHSVQSKQRGTNTRSTSKMGTICGYLEWACEIESIHSASIYMEGRTHRTDHRQIIPTVQDLDISGQISLICMI